MADSKIPLSIIIQTVDRATAVIRRVNERMARLTAPVRQLGASLGALGKEAGLSQVVAGFAGVGGAVKDLLGTVLKIGIGVGAAAFGMMALIGHFDDLGDAAERIGVSVDRLAALRFAAERSGAPVEALDAGLQTFNKTLGQVKAGTGRLAGFLEKVSPTLLRQLKAAKTGEEGFDLLANAIVKVKDPMRRAALASAAFGGEGSALVPLLAKGGAGIKALTDRYTELAGPQAGAAEAAGKVDDSLHDLHAATDGVKAALVEGLAPAFLEITQQLVKFFKENREKIAEWAEDFGKKLPERIKAFADGLEKLVGKVSTVVEAIGGFKTVAIALAAILAGKLLFAVYALGTALLTTPVGWVIAGIAAIAAGAILIVTNWDKISAFFSDMWLGIKQTFSDALEFIKETIDAIVRKVTEAVDFLSGKGLVNLVTGTSSIEEARKSLEAGQRPLLVSEGIRAALGQPAAAAPAEARVKVDFANAPKGTRVSTDPRSTADVDLSVGYQMILGGAF